ncbi:hypothetical protein GSI_07871 [Ganoderma sinense ZZ0214-1]|uniref:F-box domain-containing protein n=1 Tax=Ganoderma sinense ZZ0214-1 TaxID=1077348 RepID=A0A2G8S853_9APHY|nr:hypothetical protein GSI_07871 [Ganoderma sinense ZZ0214-1]
MPELWMALSNTVLNRQNKPTQVNRHLFRLFLARSKQLPLFVSLAADTRAANKLALHMDRVHSLELVDFPDPCKLEPLVRSASALEYLLLTSPPSSSVFNTREPMRQAPVLFSGSAPSLRALALFHPAFLPRQPFPMLTDLHVGGMSKPRLQDLFGLLRGSPALESLAITDLRIPTPFTHGMALLRHLAVPREATLGLLELFADRNVGPVAIVPPQLPPVSAANALEMVVCGGALAFRTRVLAADGSVASGPRAHCTARWGAHAYTWWKGLWQTLPCAQLTELRVAVDADDDEILPRFLDAAIALTILELRLHPRDRDRGASWGEGGENVCTCWDGAPQALLGVCALLEQELPVVCPCLAELALIDAASSSSAWDRVLQPVAHLDVSRFRDYGLAHKGTDSGARLEWVQQ